MPTTIAAAISAGVASLTAGFTLGGSVAWALKAGALLTLNHLLSERPDAPDGLDITKTATFSSGPARWVLGRAKVGGVVAFWDEDWDVPNTEGGGGPGADDLHLVIALSEGECEAIEGVWIGDEFFKVKFNDAEQKKYIAGEAQDGFPPPIFYKRRDEKEKGVLKEKSDWYDPDEPGKIKRDHAFPLDLDPGSEAYFDVPSDRWYDKPGNGRKPLDPDDEDDAEKIRRASLSGAVSIWPYLNKDDYDNSHRKFHGVRYYTDDRDNDALYTGSFDDGTRTGKATG
ncbi:MAG: hypothetical protein ISN29_10830, partial [Gammaproteobacteria bacterium AqS3]|nr:hypothetical protein [Gammaproteobacteria bacterium AqS3]